MERDELEKIVRSRMPLLTRNTKGKHQFPFVSNHARNEVIEDVVYGIWEDLSKLHQPTVSVSNSCFHEWEITTGRCVKCGKSKYY